MMGETVNFAACVKLYECSSAAVFHDWQVDDERVSQFGRGVSALKRAFTSMDESPASVEKLALAAFSLCAAPLPLNHPAILSQEDQLEIAADVQTWRERYGDQLYEDGNRCVELLASLRRSSDNPLLNSLSDAMTSTVAGDEGQNGDALLLKTARLAESSVELLRSAGFTNFELVHPRDLYHERCFDRLVVVGPLRWYRPSKDSEHNPIVTASRASTVHIIRWGWMSDSIPQPAFASIKGAKSGVHVKLRSTGSSDTPADSETLPSVTTALEPDELIPSGQGLQVVSRADVVMVRARIFRLEGVGCIALPIAQPWRVVDFESDKAVRWLKVGAVEPDMALVLGERGQGDYIAEVADREILRDRAAAVRECAAKWREPLRRMLRAYARRWPEAQQQLRQNGAGDVAVNMQNVRNWASGIVLGPEKYDDYVAVMRVLGISAETLMTWRAIVDLRRAHAKAGHRVGKMLLRALQSGDKSRLEKEGVQVFELPGLSGRKIGAYRVVEVVNEDVEVDESRVGRPFRCEEY